MVNWKSALRVGTSARCKLQLFLEAVLLFVLQVNLASPVWSACLGVWVPTPWVSTPL